jgi:hypothetical protein
MNQEDWVKIVDHSKYHCRYQINNLQYLINFLLYNYFVRITVRYLTFIF